MLNLDPDMVALPQSRRRRGGPCISLSVCRLAGERGKAEALAGEAFEKRRRLEARIVRPTRPIGKPVADDTAYGLTLADPRVQRQWAMGVSRVLGWAAGALADPPVVLARKVS